MTSKTVATDLAQALIDGLAISACAKCGESIWLKAPPIHQTKRLGFLTVRCRTCANKASLINKAQRYATDETYREAQKARYAVDEKYKEAQKAWPRENPGKKNAHSAKRRTQKLQATPAWSDLAAIQEFYEHCPEGHHVDHIVPLQGHLVSGLHVPANLQYLTAFENISKGNKFTG